MRPRRGSLLIEASVSIAVLAGAGVLLTQFLQAVAAQQRQLEQQSLAQQTAANLLEAELHRPVAELVSKPELAIAPEVQSVLWEGHAELVVMDQPAAVEQPAGKQLRVTVSWGPTAQRESVHLVGWRFPVTGETP
ncbi:MAG TPA: hypothetical protein VL096_08965 [Pirellulaceae bacterium]|nr:hypothetical protein [Pirellulaceae bacterium]